MYDTFFVFAGSFELQVDAKVEPGESSPYDKMHVDLFDYMTFMLPITLDRITSWGMSKFRSNFFAVLVTLFTIIPMIATVAARYILSAIFTVLSIPVIGIVQGIAALNANKLKNSVKATNIASDTSSDIITEEAALISSSHKTVAQLLTDEKNTLNDYKVKISGNYKEVKLELQAKNSDNSEKVEINLNLYQPKDRQAFCAMLRLNFGGMTTKLESQDVNINKFNYALPESESNEKILPLSMGV